MAEFSGWGGLATAWGWLAVRSGWASLAPGNSAPNAVVRTTAVAPNSLKEIRRTRCSPSAPASAGFPTDAAEGGVGGT
jgi:hypothetical protein